MGDIHFLNIEYFLLRAYEIFFSVPAVEGVVEEAQAPASEALSSLAFWVWQIALLGMALTTVLLIMAVWVKVRSLMAEHELEERDEAEMHVREQKEEVVQEASTSGRQTRWDKVMELANSSSESDWRHAIMEADVMLADLLEEQGYRGESVGEKLRDANPLQFTTLDLAWQAHKMRNNIAHGGEDFVLSPRDVKATIDLYRRVFEEFSFI